MSRINLWIEKITHFLSQILRTYVRVHSQQRKVLREVGYESSQRILNSSCRSSLQAALYYIALLHRVLFVKYQHQIMIIGLVELRTGMSQKLHIAQSLKIIHGIHPYIAHSRLWTFKEESILNATGNRASF